MRAEMVDVTFVGGGPVALYGLFYAGMVGLSTRVIESLSELGGQLAALYPEKMVYDVPGFPAVRARDLVDQLLAQSSRFLYDVRTGETVQQLQAQPDGTYILRTTAQGEYPTRTVIVTTGAGAFTPRRLALPGADRFEGKGLQYTVPQLERFRGQRVLIVGGGDSAVDWALSLEPLARSVTLIHRRGQFRALEESVEQLLSSSVDVRLFHELRAIEGDERVTAAIIYNNQTGEETRLPVDEIVLALGFVPDVSLLRSWGLDMDDNAIVVRSDMSTNLPGVYAAGDVVTYPGKVKLIATGFGEVATAVAAARRHINPQVRTPLHSSSMKW